MAFLSPVYQVRPVPIEQIEPNAYNPNSVAPPELRLLYDSIREDGYTMPIVCYHDQDRDVYIIIDGFHRYRVMLDYPDIYQREQGKLPVSVVDKPLDCRMASTIRHQPGAGDPQCGFDEQHHPGAPRVGAFGRLDFQAPGHGPGRNPTPEAAHRSHRVVPGCEVQPGLAGGGGGPAG